MKSPKLLRSAIFAVCLAGTVCQGYALSGETVITQRQIASGDTLAVFLGKSDDPLQADEIKLEICGAFDKTRSAKDGELSISFADTSGVMKENFLVVRSPKLMGDEETQLTITPGSIANENGSFVVTDDYSRTDGVFAVCFDFKADNCLELLAGVDDYQQVVQKQMSYFPRKALITASVPFTVVAVNLKAEPSAFEGRSWSFSDCQPEDLNGGGVTVYRYLDNEVNNSRVLRGGDYSLALKANGKGGYSLYYLSGAIKNRDAWHPGMSKGELSPTIFENHYDLSWRDADFATDFDGAWGELIESGAILVLHFPHEEAVLRFSRQD